MINRPEGMGHAAGSGFECGGRSRSFAAGADLECYWHHPTGARHLHLAMPGEDCAFLMAFRTPAPDSSGLTHILEHLVMCGSERYPCRRTFFAMLGRTLGGAMNALTCEDCTAYHFVTRNLADYENLLSVYLDAAFFPRLDERDFHREGSRVELEVAEDGDPVPVRRGVVLSEMRGAMGEPEAQLQQALNRALFPGSPYRFNAGGDPRHIPALEYEALLRYHRRHYRPGNAIFLSAGSLRAEWLQERLQESVLARFPDEVEPPPPVDIPSLTAPTRSVVHYPVADGTSDTRDGSGVALAWRVGGSADPLALARARLLARCLLEQGDAPLRYALETPVSAAAALASNGVRETGSRLVFQCGALGCGPDEARKVEARVLAAVERASREGFAKSEVEAACTALERELREHHDRRYPLPLKLLVRLLPAALYGGEPAAVLDLPWALEGLRARLRSREDSAKLVRRELADNPARACVIAIPDSAAGRRLEEEDRTRLERTFSRSRRAACGSPAEFTSAHVPGRRPRSGESSLPRLGLDAIGPARPRARLISQSAGNPRVWSSRGATGGLVYARLAVDADGIGSECLDDLGLMAEVLPESGHGECSAPRTRAHLAAVCDRLSVEPWLLARSGRCSGAPDTAPRTVFMLSARARAADEPALIEVLANAHLTARFEPSARHVAARAAGRVVRMLTRDGHLHAERVAAAQLGLWDALAERWQGPSAVGVLTRSAGGEGEDEALAGRLHRVHQALAAAPCQLQIVRDENGSAAVDPRRTWRDRFTQLPAPSEQNRDRRRAPPPSAWIVGGTVNYCAKVYPAVNADHPDAGPLGVLAALLGGDLLARAVREEGGAYGAGARYCGRSATLRVFSYRDPRLGETLRDFDRAAATLRRRPPGRRRLEEAILRAVRELDRPRAFQIAAFERYLDELQGRDPEGEHRRRESTLRTGAEALRETARRYLRPERGRVGVIAAAGRERELDRLGMPWCRI